MAGCKPRSRSCPRIACDSRCRCRRTMSTMRSSTPPRTSRRARRSPASARARCRARCSCSASAGERLMAEAIDSHISGWFWNAAARSRVRPVEQPQYDFELPASDDQDWEFTATVAVQAKPELPDWTTLEVGAIEPEVPDELVQGELDALRSTVAELVPVEGRPVGQTTPSWSTSSHPAASPAATTSSSSVAAAWSRRSSAASSGSRPAGCVSSSSSSPTSRSSRSTVTVKEIKEKVLPEIDDELARSASEFETFAELRAEIESRLLAQIARGDRGPVQGRGGRCARRRLQGRRVRPPRRGADARAAPRPCAPGRGPRRRLRDLPGR